MGEFFQTNAPIVGVLQGVLRGLALLNILLMRFLLLKWK